MTLQAGTIIGAYEILSSIGAGGMGEVYKARDGRLNRLVAIKVLREDLALDADARRSFEREARTVAALNHPHICTLYDIGKQDGLEYLVMEYLEGQTLAQRLEKGALPVEEALEIAVDIAEALEKAHQHGVVHRDLKPGNIMLTSMGTKLLDFGLSQGLRSPNIANTDSTSTVPAQPVETIAGTLAYLAPESLEGGRTDERADIWSFGCVLFEMLTGRRAFGVHTFSETIARILKDDPDWHLLPGSTPLSTHAVLRVCLAKDPRERPARMLKITRVLEQPAALRKHNLPHQLNPFVGREQELRDLTAVLARDRLVTLTGPGGVGKTRLAIQAGQMQLGEFCDGVWLVELATIDEPQFAGQVVAAALGVREEAARPIAESLLEYLETRTALIILDNCEHVIEAAGSLAEEILDRSNGTKIIATSRRPLSISGERLWRVPPLSMPERRSTDVPVAELQDVAGLQDYDAIRLFLERARSVSPDFVLTTRNSGAVLEICSRLDGIPLAIELAAARVRILSPKQIEERLFDRFVLLRAGSRTTPTRHESLQATLDWSYDLLSDEEKQVFRELAVFAGGWTLEAAEAICITHGNLQIFEALSLLTDKCLIRSIVLQSEVRFEFSETVRQYAREKLKRSRELYAVNDRHLAYFAGMAMQSEPKVHGPAQQAVLEELAAEDDNLRAALTWALQSNVPLALEMTNSLWESWQIRGRLIEAEGWLARAAAGEVSEENRILKAKALCTLASIANMQGKPQPARQFAEEALTTFREKVDEYGVARCLGNLGLAAFHKGEYELAGSVFEEALVILRRLGNSRAVVFTLSNIGLVARRRSDPQKARDYFELALQIARGLEDQWLLAAILSNLGLVYQDQNDLFAAEKLWIESLAIRRRLADRQGIATGLFNLSAVSLEKGEVDTSVKLLLEAITYYYELREEANLAAALLYLARTAVVKEQYRRAAVLVGSAVSQKEISLGPWSPHEAAIHTDLISLLEEKLGKDSFSAAVIAGHSMTTDQALAHARSGA